MENQTADEQDSEATLLGVISCTIQHADYDGVHPNRHGVILTIEGSKPPDFVCEEQLYLHLHGDAVWAYLPGPLTWLIQQTFLPLALSPWYCDAPSTFIEGQTTFKLVMGIGTKQNGTFGVRDVKIEEVLNWMSADDPTLKVGFSNGEYEDLLFELPELRPSVILRVLQENKNGSLLPDDWKTPVAAEVQTPVQDDHSSEAVKQTQPPNTEAAPPPAETSFIAASLFSLSAATEPTPSATVAASHISESRYTDTNAQLISLSVEDVQVLIHNLRLSRFAAAMLENEVSGLTLDCCEHEDELPEIGVDKKIFARQLFRKIQRFQKEGVPRQMFSEMSSPAADRKSKSVLQI